MRHTIAERGDLRVEAVRATDLVPPPESQGWPTVIMHEFEPLVYTIASWPEGVDTDQIARSWIAARHDLIDFGKWMNEVAHNLIDWEKLGLLEGGNWDEGHEPRPAVRVNIQRGYGYQQGEQYLVLQFHPEGADVVPVEEVELLNWALGNSWYLKLSRRDEWQNLRTGERREEWVELDHEYSYPFFAEIPTTYSYVGETAGLILDDAEEVDQ